MVPSPADAGFPDKPIKIVVPFAAGGSLDVVARPLADFLSKDLGKAVIIENRVFGKSCGRFWQLQSAGSMHVSTLSRRYSWSRRP